MQQQENSSALNTPEANRIIASIREFDAQVQACEKTLKQIEEIENVAKHAPANLAKLRKALEIDQEMLKKIKEEVVNAFEAAKKANQAPLHRNAKKKLEKSIEEEVKTSPSDAATASQ